MQPVQIESELTLFLMQLWLVEGKRLEIEFGGVRMYAHSSGALFVPEVKFLIIADLHIGKAEHFRQNGLPLPTAVNATNLSKLAMVFEEFAPKKVIFLGDIIHSAENSEWTAFVDFLSNFQELDLMLIRGNHDRQPNEFFERNRIEVVESFVLKSILLSHEPNSELELYNLSGHVHPAVLLNGTAKQSMRLPCFYFTKKSGLMPAFGSFTGSATIRPKTGDRVLILFEDKVVDLSARIFSQK